MSISQMHEGLVHLFREHPSLAVELLGISGKLSSLSHVSAVLDTENLSDLAPAERRADAVLLLKDETGQTSCAIVLEIQLAWDSKKLYRWPAYAAVLRDRRECEVEVVVVALDAALAHRIAEPILLGPSNWFFVSVIGPASVPIVVDPVVASSAPGLALLSAIAHPSLARARLAIDAIAGLDPVEAALHFELLSASVDSALRTAMEGQMANGEYEIQSEFLRKWRDKGLAEGRDKGLAEGRDKGLAEGREKGLALGRVEGRTEGLAEGRLAASRSALLLILAARGLAPSDAQRGFIDHELDHPRIERWIRAACSASSVDEVFLA